jgi:hypothetical protein
VRHVASALALTLGLGAACSGSGNQHQAGRVEAHWTGVDSGRVSGPATAQWCADRRSLEVRAVQGDGGFAIVMYPLDTIEPDTYRVVKPEGADSLAPSAAVALRLFSPGAIKGFQGDSGDVVLEHSGSAKLSGSVHARARSVTNSERLLISGKFRDLSVVPQARGCAPESAADSIGPNAESPGADVD